MKFHIYIYGCQMNYADSARIATVLKNIGWEQTDLLNADIVIFDTCSVRQKSEDKITGKLNEISKNKKIWLTGCMVQHNLKYNRIIKNSKLAGNWNIKFKTGNFIGNLSQISFKEIPFLINEVYQPLWSTLKQKFDNLELMFRVDDIHLLPKFIEYLGYHINKNQVEEITNYLELIPQNTNHFFGTSIKTAYVPISTGCNQFCSYCIVPFARGLERYRSITDIVKEVKYWVKKGKQEIVLLGQIVNKHPDFVKILKELLKIKGIKWIRYMSPYPTFYNKEIFSLHENEKVLCPHIHIPLQSGSNKILKLMNRGYTVDDFKKFIDKINNLKREISITTDIIVGFSNETEEDFNQTLDIVKYSRFDMIYIGIYSPRPNTMAYKLLEDNIDRKVKQQRRKILNDLLYEISLENNKKEVGKNKEAIIIGTKRNSKGEKVYYGYTDNYKNIEIQFENNLDFLGNIINTTIINCTSLKLFGKI